jgi:mannose-1-phosphate guanylyltransferase
MIRYAVIMAGGSGERFWPVSRQDRPKQLLRLTHPEQTLLEEAVLRAEPMFGVGNTFIATGHSLRKSILATGLIESQNILAEPCKKNTLGCLAWVAANLVARHAGGEAGVSMAVLTADHSIGTPEVFRQTLDKALTTAEKTGGLVTIGIKPVRPETGYGYVELAEVVDPSAPEVFRVSKFREKPDLKTAEHYVGSGNYLWNSGMFFWTLKAFLAEMSHANPEVFQTIVQMATLIRQGSEDSAAKVFEDLPSESIDYALLEKANQVYTVAGSFPWDDVGAWDALERSLPSDENSNVILGEAIAVESEGTIIYNDSKRMLATTIGVKDLIIVVTDNAVLVCPKSEAQRVKEILKELPSDSHLR